MQSTSQKSEPQSSTKGETTEPVSTEKESQGSVAVATKPEGKTNKGTEASTEMEDNTEKSKIKTQKATIPALEYTKHNELQKAKTPEDRKRILSDYKRFIDRYDPEESKAFYKKLEKNLKKHGSKVKSLNAQEKSLEELINKKDTSDEDKAKYKEQIEKIDRMRSKLLEQ